MFTDTPPPDWFRLAPLGILAAALGALATAYAVQYVLGAEPCVLCLYQRIPYAAAGVLGLAALTLAERRHRAWTVGAAGAVFLAGGGIAFYHVGVEQHWWASAAACGAGGGGEGPGTVEDLRRMLSEKPPKACDEVDWTLFGLSMATYNVGASLAFALGSFWGAAEIRRKM